MKYILDSEKQEQFLLQLTSDVDSQDGEISTLCHGCRYFEFEVHINAYFLSKSMLKIIRRERKNAIDLSELFRSLEESSLHMQMFDADFIEYLLSNNSQADLELDKELQNVLENYIRRYE